MKTHTKTLTVAALLTTTALTVTAYAMDNAEKSAKQNVTHYSAEDVNKAWGNTKDAAAETWKDTKEVTADAWDATKEGANNIYSEVKHFVTSEEQIVPNVPHAMVSENSTTSYILGNAVRDMSGNEIATIQDIVINEDGSIEGFILSSGGVLGLGSRLVMVQPNSLSFNSNGEAAIMVSKDAYESMAEFSYDTDSRNTMTLADDQLSIRNLKDGVLKTKGGESVANIDDLVIERGEVKHVIATFGGTLGMNETSAVVPFENTTVESVEGGKMSHIVMNPNQTRAFYTLQNCLES